MVVLEAAVDVPDEDGRAAAGDRVRLDALDLAQTPLEARERVGIRRWLKLGASPDACRGGRRRHRRDRRRRRAAPPESSSVAESPFASAQPLQERGSSESAMTTPIRS